MRRLLVDEPAVKNRGQAECSAFFLTFLPDHAGCTKSGTPKLAKTQKPPKSQLFELSLKPLEGFENGKIISWSKLDTQDHVPEVLS